MFVSGAFSISGSIRTIPTRVSTTYTLNNTDYFVPVSASAPFTITLPASPFDGQTFIVKDAVGNCSTHNVTVSSSANRIDGSPTHILSVNYASVTLAYVSGFSTWSII